MPVWRTQLQTEQLGTGKSLNQTTCLCPLWLLNTKLKNKMLITPLWMDWNSPQPLSNARPLSYWEHHRSAMPNLNTAKLRKIHLVQLVKIISFYRRMFVMEWFHNVRLNLNLFVLNVIVGLFYPTTTVTPLWKIVQPRTETSVPRVLMACSSVLMVNAMWLSLNVRPNIMTLVQSVSKDTP